DRPAHARQDGRPEGQRLPTNLLLRHEALPSTVTLRCDPGLLSRGSLEGATARADHPSRPASSTRSRVNPRSGARAPQDDGESQSFVSANETSSPARDWSLVRDRPSIAQHHQPGAVAIGKVKKPRVRVLEDFTGVAILARGRATPRGGAGARRQVVPDEDRRERVGDVHRAHAFVVPGDIDEARRALVEPRQMRGGARAATRPIAIADELL